MTTISATLWNCLSCPKHVFWVQRNNTRRPERQRLYAWSAALFMFALVLGSMSGMANTNSLAIPFVNQTGLDTNRYTIYVLGYSTGRTDPNTVEPVVLASTGTTGVASFVPYPDLFGTNTSGYVPSYKMDEEISSISVNLNTDRVAGARVFFFVADNQLSYSSNGLPPRFSFSNGGRAVTQCPNPPQTNYPIYNYIEFTYIHGDDYGAVIDVSAVDGFNFPASITVNNDLVEPLGQPTGIADSDFNRSIILDGYQSFMTNLAAEGGTNYLCLSYTNASGGLLNPTYYIDPANEEGLISPLNTVFDEALNKFFQASNASNLSITTDGSGTIPVDTYTARYTNAVFPGTTLSHPALEFSSTNGQSFTVFNPVDFTVVNYPGDDNSLHYIQGQMSNTFLNFTTPLPADTPIVTNMYVTGSGANTETKIVAINYSTNGSIASLELSNGSGIATAGNFRFSKASDVNAVSSGAMVFGCYALFDHTQGLVGDEQKVLLALKRDIVTALNRGVAHMAPSTGAVGRTSTYWGMQTNWYPEGEVQNLFSLYMHTACVRAGTNDIPIFTRPSNAVACARGTLMGMSYGFAYDENSVHLSVQQPQVPAKHDPLPAGVTNATVILGAWAASSTSSTNNPVNDFNGDGKSDYTVFNRNSGDWYVLAADQTNMIAWDHQWGWSNAWPVSGDFDGDGKYDYAVFEQNSGDWYILSADKNTLITWGLRWGWPGAWPVSGDFDGDGKSDFAVFDQNTGDWYVLSADQSTVIAWGVRWGWPGAWPVSGDYDGDGKSDFAVLDQNSGDWYVLGADQSTVIAWGLRWGWRGAWPVSGDFNGDGKSDYSVFDQSSGYWYVLSYDQVTTIAWEHAWGWVGAWPVSGDFDGDGKSDFAVYEENSGLWYVISADQTTVITWGLTWGMPGAWLPGMR